MKPLIPNLSRMILWALLIIAGAGSAQTDANCYSFSNVSLAQVSSFPVDNARAWESFRIGEHLYLAAAQFTDQYPDGNKDIYSTIFQWTSTSGFQKYQTLLTHGARSVRFITFEGKHYLVIANLQTNVNSKAPYTVYSVVYQWNGDKFVEYQKIPTNKAIAVELMTINNKLYLAFASLATKPANQANIYQWDGKFFKPFQTIKQSQANALIHFSIGTKHFLAVGNSIGNSILYRWQKDKFVYAQDIPITNVRALTYFNDKNTDYLAIASQDHSAIYKWNLDKFIAFKQDQSLGGRDWTYLQFQGKSYLFLSHFIHDKPKETNFNLTVYQLGNRIHQIAELPTAGIGALLPLHIDKNTYLVVTKLFSNSLLYEISKDKGCAPKSNGMMGIDNNHPAF